MAQRMPLDRPLTIVTNSLPVATTLAERTNIQVIILGGRVRGSTMGVVDQWPTQMLSGLVIDLAIIGANGITLEHGMTTPGPAVAAVKAAAAAPYILAGHSIDIPFFFNNLGAPYVREYTGPNPPQELADFDHHAFASFATTGNPGWPSFFADSAVMIIDTEPHLTHSIDFDA